MACQRYRLLWHASVFDCYAATFALYELHVLGMQLHVLCLVINNNNLIHVLYQQICCMEQRCGAKGYEQQWQQRHTCNNAPQNVFSIRSAVCEHVVPLHLPVCVDVRAKACAVNEGATTGKRRRSEGGGGGALRVEKRISSGQARGRDKRARDTNEAGGSQTPTRQEGMR
jgi:hypothetical protein